MWSRNFANKIFPRALVIVSKEVVFKSCILQTTLVFLHAIDNHLKCFVYMFGYLFGYIIFKNKKTFLIVHIYWNASGLQIKRPLKPSFSCCFLVLNDVSVYSASGELHNIMLCLLFFNQLCLLSGSISYKVRYYDQVFSVSTNGQRSLPEPHSRLSHTIF